MKPRRSGSSIPVSFSRGSMPARVRAAASAFRQRVAGVLTAGRRPLPDWWASAWEQALGIALLLAESVAQGSGALPAADPSRRAPRHTPPRETGAARMVEVGYVVITFVAGLVSFVISLALILVEVVFAYRSTSWDLPETNQVVKGQQQ